MHVLHLETGRRLYGGARQVLWLAQGLAGRGVDSTILCAAGSELLAAARDAGLRAEGLPVPGDIDPTLAFRLVRRLRALRPDLVHLHSRRGADSWGLLAARRCGLPVVLSRRVDEPLGALTKQRLRRADRVIAISAGVAAVLRAGGIADERLRVVRSAVPPARRPAWPLQRFRETFGLHPADRPVAVVAQFIPRKGHRLLLAAALRARAAEPRLRLLLFGSGPLEAALRAEFAAAGLGDTVCFAGYRPDLANFLGHCELLLHPARREGLGVALLEAQAAGLPVVGHAVPGVAEAVRDGRSGLLVPPGDPDALAAALLRLLRDAGLRRRLGAAARERAAREFGIDAMVDGNLAVYRELLPATREARA
ncbi:MAG: glycosyltransferase [Gammaproteobacteria bacterium]|nr:MAG: glycosyltransferase [Gammaproteobacteria bacterium]